MAHNHKSERLLARLSEYYRKKTGGLPEKAKKYSAGQFVYIEGERPKGIYFVCNGWVKIVREGIHGEELILRLAGKNEFIGFVSLIKRWDYTSSAIAAEGAEVQFIPKAFFLQLLTEDISFANLVLETLCEQLTKGEETISGLIGMGGKQRLAALLIGLEMAFDENKNYENSLVRLPRKDMAAAIGITPETVSRYLAEFKKKKFIRATDGTIEILNRSALLRFSKVND
jgi:CRP-like cAMP-binding protein